MPMTISGRHPRTMAGRAPSATLPITKGGAAMHMSMLGDSQLYIFRVEHEERVREGARQRLKTEARRAEARREKPTTARGFIPRVAGALGLF